MAIISVIVGSTRQGRFSEKPARWILGHLQKRAGIEARLLDLRDYQLPFFDEPIPPGRAPYENEAVRRWTTAIAAADGFAFVTPEYNHSIPAVLKNAIDYVLPEWKRKAAAFISYGGTNGVRAVEQLRQIILEIQLASVPKALHIPVQALAAHFQGGDVDSALAELEAPANAMIDDLLWWTTTLKAARLAG